MCRGGGRQALPCSQDIHTGSRPHMSHTHAAVHMYTQRCTYTHVKLPGSGRACSASTRMCTCQQHTYRHAPTEAAPPTRTVLTPSNLVDVNSKETNLQVVKSTETHLSRQLHGLGRWGGTEVWLHAVQVNACNADGLAWLCPVRACIREHVRTCGSLQADPCVVLEWWVALRYAPTSGSQCRALFRPMHAPHACVPILHDPPASWAQAPKIWPPTATESLRG